MSVENESVSSLVLKSAEASTERNGGRGGTGVVARPVQPRSTLLSVLHRGFSFPVLLGATLVAGVCASIYLKLHEMPTLPPGHTHLAIIEGDTWLHILIGEDLLRTRTFPTKESYSFTADGKPSMAFEWLGQVGMALVNRAGGLRALAASVILLTALLMLLIYYYAWLSSGNSKASFVASVLMMPLISPFYTLRPQLLGYIFLAITLILLAHFRQGRRKPLWLLPALFVV